MHSNRALLIAVVGFFCASLVPSFAAKEKVIARTRIKLKIKGGTHRPQKASRTAIFEQLHGGSAIVDDAVAASQVRGPSAPTTSRGPGEPVPTVPPQVNQTIELSGPIPDCLNLDVVLTYASSNRTQDVWVDDNTGWAQAPKTKEVRPDVEYVDGKYKIVLPTFNKGWFGAKYYLLSAKIIVNKDGADPAEFEIRGDVSSTAIGVEQTLKVQVTAKAGWGNEKLTLQVQTYAGPAAKNILALPNMNGFSGDGQFWLEIPIELANR